MDPKQHVSASLAVLAPVVDAIRPDQLHEPTPCTQWTVADLLGHLTGGGHFFAGALRGEAPPTEAPAEAPAEAPDPRAAFHGAIDDFNDALRGVDDLDASITLPWGTMPTGGFLRLAACDLLIHAWDLARATGQPLSPPAALVDESEPTLRSMIAPEMRSPEVFDVEVTPPAGAGPLERMIAFSGRQP